MGESHKSNKRHAFTEAAAVFRRHGGILRTMEVPLQVREALHPGEGPGGSVAPGLHASPAKGQSPGCRQRGQPPALVLVSEVITTR